MNSRNSVPKRPKYEQRKDRTLSPFMRKGESIVGERAVEGQSKKRKVTSEDVRVVARGSSQTLRNEGLHEVIPTNKRNEMEGRKHLSHIQSGLRTSPSTTVFRRKDGELGGHTQTFVKRSGQGSTHTKGQGPAHDELRDEFVTVKKRKLSEPASSASMMSRQLRITASGPEIMKSDYLTDALPNSLSAKGPLESPKAKSKPNRTSFARSTHSKREQAKQRYYQFVQQEVPEKEVFQFAPPSPMRAPMEQDGTGGGYLRAPFPLPQIPEFPTEQRQAHTTAWMTQPLRSEKDK